jgi:hypothetical protein
MAGSRGGRTSAWGRGAAPGRRPRGALASPTALRAPDGGPLHPGAPASNERTLSSTGGCE